MVWLFGKKSPTRTVNGATGQRTEKTTITDTNFKEFIDDDAVLNSNLRQLTDAIFEHQLEITREDEKSLSNKRFEDRKIQLKKVNFTRTIKDNFASLFHNGNMFFEIVVSGNNLKEFYWIDADSMKVEEDDFGNPIKYIQTQPHGDKIIPKERIIHIKAPGLRTGTLGQPLLLPLTYTLNRKKVAENYLAGMVENLSPLLYIELGEADDKQANDIKDSIRVKRDPLDPLKLITLLPGEKVSKVDTGSTVNFDAIQRYIDSQNNEIIRVIQIPPIVAGTIDNSNRSNSEIQERAVFGRTVDAWKEWLENEFDLAFIDKLGWKETEFEFPEADERKQEAALVRATKLKELGYSQEAIHKVLIDSGIDVEEDFAPIPVDSPKDINDMPSRQPRPKTGIPQNEKKRLQDVKNGTKKILQ